MATSEISATQTKVGFHEFLAVTAVAPIDRVKLLRQTEKELLRTGRLQCRFPRAAINTPLGPARSYNAGIFRHITKFEGLRAFYRSNLPNLMRSVPTELGYVYFGTWFDEVLRAEGVTTDTVLGKYFLSVATSGVASTLTLSIAYPFDYIRTLLACDVKPVYRNTTTGVYPQRMHLNLGRDGPFGNGQHKYLNCRDAIRQTFKNGGITTFYTGFAISCVGILLYRGILYGTIAAFSQLSQINQLSETVAENPDSDPELKKNVEAIFEEQAYDFVKVCILSAFVIGATYPIDTVRRRVMVASTTPRFAYANSWECLKYIMKRENVRQSLYRGFTLNFMRYGLGAVVLSGIVGKAQHKQELGQAFVAMNPTDI